MKNFDFWCKWLSIVAYLIIILGLVIAFSEFTWFFEINDKIFNPVFWGQNSIPHEIVNFQKWNFGVLGGIITGWGVFFVFICQYPFKNKEKWAWKCLFTGASCWFIIDTSYSIFYFVFPNVFLNSIIYLGILIPLLATRKEF